MTTKDYSGPKTVKEIIDKVLDLQKSFNEHSNLKDLEEAIKILNEAIENSTDEDAREKYFYERDRLLNRYPYDLPWLSEDVYDNYLQVFRQMTYRDYTNPITVEEIIKKCRWSQEEFNSEINLDYLEEALEILDKAIENTPEDDPSREKYVYERNRLYNRYPDLEKWLSGPRHDYCVDIKYQYRQEYAWDGDEDYYEMVDRIIIIKYINEFNQKKEKDIQEFFTNQNNIFTEQFHYAMIGFEGKEFYQGFGNKYFPQDWVGIFLGNYEYPKWGNDESLNIRNAPLLGKESKVSLPFRPNFLDDDKNTSSNQKDIDKAHYYYLPIDIRYFDWNEELHSSIGYFGFSRQQINNISKARNLLKTKEANDLDIKSFNFLIDYLCITDDVYEKLIKDQETIWGWDHSFIQKSEGRIISEEQIPSTEWDKLRCLKGDHRENIFGNIEIKKEGVLNGEWVMLEDSFVSLRLFYNNQNPELNSYDWEITDSDYHYTFYDDLPINDFLAKFPDLDEI